MWGTVYRTPTFYAWAGDTFELLCVEHLEQLQYALHIATIDRCYCWSGQNAEGKGAQIDLVLESKAARTDYLCEMKFTEGKYGITASDESNILNKIDAFAGSKMHSKSHSIQLVIVTTVGLARGEHAGIANQVVSMDDLFAL